MWRLSVLALLSTASAQIPSLGWCPDYIPMANFNVNRFLGSWYEAERYFTVSELVSRCVTTKYGNTPEGRIIVSNEITNSLTGLKRVMDGSLQLIGPEGEGRISIKYSTLPRPYETEYSILDTDYDNYAVMWSCSGIGPVHTQNAWILTRERLANSAVMQNAYAVLDRYKISRTFFVKTNQADCTILPNPAADPIEEKDAAVEDPKDVIIVPEVIKKEEDSKEKKGNSEPKIEDVPQERSAASEIPEEPAKPLKIPELILSQTDKKDIYEKPEESNSKQKTEEQKTESIALKDQEKKPLQ